MYCGGRLKSQLISVHDGHSSSALSFFRFSCFFSMRLRAMESIGRDYKEEDNSGSFNDQSAQGALIRGKRTRRRTADFSRGVTEGEQEEEEEYMANCLMLLSRGLQFNDAPSQCRGGGTYECKSCGKSFPSFQALGGHRASHKKPSAAPDVPDERRPQSAGEAVFAPLMMGRSSKARVLHECSVCGSEFSSGQALGGHMRRHRPIAAAAQAAPGTTMENLHALSLDLNLPAPSDDNHGNDF